MIILQQISRVMKKVKLFFVIISLFSIGLVFYIGYNKLIDRRENISTELIKSEISLIVHSFTNRSTLIVLEAQCINSIKVKVHRRFFNDFFLDYIVVGSFTYGIDLSGFQSEDITATKDSVIITVSKPELFNYTVDHTQSRFVNATWRFGINEFEVADSAYVRAQNHLREYAGSPDIASKAAIAGEEAIRELLSTSGISKPVRVSYK